MKLAVVIPTYNEKSNITTLFPKIFDVCNKNGINICLIVVDDNSPDGTAKAVKKLGNYDIELIERKGKLGIGTAYIAGFRKALELNADLIMSMDADWTHQPESIKILVGASDKFDVVIGSRYIPGGVLKNYPPEFLRSTIKVLLPAILVSYLFYSFQASDSPHFILTVPLVVFGLLRYLFLIEEKSAHENPTDLFFEDRPIFAVVILWLAAVVGILIFG